MSILAAENLTKRFVADGSAVDGVTFELEQGEFLALVGPSGCGKTTLLRILAGFESPDSGSLRLGRRVLVGGKTWTRPEQRGVGMVFQDYALFPHLSVLENVTFGLHRMARGKRAARGQELLSIVGLAGFDQRRPHELSGGEQQRVALARALAPRPDMVLLDEPFSGLDAALRVDMRHEVRSLLKEQGVSTILVTHDQEEALATADRIGVMRRGRLLQLAAPDELYNSPRSAFVAHFFGGANIIAGAATGRTADTRLGTVTLQSESRGKVLVALRPEELRLEAAQGGEANATVMGYTFRGRDRAYRVDVAGRECRVLAPATCSFRTGDLVRVEVEGTGVVVEDD